MSRLLLSSSSVERCLMLANRCATMYDYIEDEYHPMSEEEQAAKRKAKAAELKLAAEAAAEEAKKAEAAQKAAAAGIPVEPEKPAGPAPLRASALRGKKLEEIEAMIASGDFVGKDLKLLTTYSKKLKTGAKTPKAAAGAAGSKYAKTTIGDIYKALEGKKKEKTKAEKKRDKKKIMDIINTMAEMQASLDARVVTSGVMTKKGGKQGQKGEQSRFFALIKTAAAHVLEYYDPNKFGKTLGSIEVNAKTALTLNKAPTPYMMKAAKATATLWAWELKENDARTYFFSCKGEDIRQRWHDQIMAVASPDVDAEEEEEEDGGEWSRKDQGADLDAEEEEADAGDGADAEPVQAPPEEEAEGGEWSRKDQGADLDEEEEEEDAGDGADSDGEMTFDGEDDEATETYGLSEEDLGRARKKFDALDQDGTGKLEGDELHELAIWVFKSFHPEADTVSEEDANKMQRKVVDRADEDGDGEMEFGEFAAWYNKTCGDISKFRQAMANRAKEALAASGLASPVARSAADEDGEWSRKDQGADLDDDEEEEVEEEETDADKVMV